MRRAQGQLHLVVIAQLQGLPVASVVKIPQVEAVTETAIHEIDQAQPVLDV
jgi:hypothetical protein